MKILIVGDQHLSGYGLAAGQRSFVSHFVRQISQSGQTLAIEARVRTSRAGIQQAMQQLSLERYDLIVWQCGSGCADHPLLAEKLASPGWFHQLKQRLRALTHPDHPLKTIRNDLGAILQLLKPQRHKVLILTPIPNQQPVENWLLDQARQHLLHESYRQGFSIFDTSSLIRAAPEYFQDRQPAYLNAVGHELLGQALFDFYQATPTIVAIRSIRRD
ncbi:hypothetical protein GCM10027578_37370 [Spirosoma luteolum]